jgi:Concanavalin A-like lectin/glucanases superfamily
MQHPSRTSCPTRVALAAAVFLGNLYLGMSNIALASTAPYPPSALVTAMTWDFSSVISMRKAAGSDLWPLAWASDGNLYGAWGDGGGFDGDSENIGRVSLGFAQITGTPVTGQPLSFAGKNVWGLAPAYAQYPATFGGKVDDLISINGVLYGQGALWTATNCDCADPVQKSGANPTDHTLVWSSNLGKTWQIAPWSGTTDLGSSLQYGQDYGGAPDPAHVYYYFQNANDSHVYLRRILTSTITADPSTPGHFEYLTSVSSSGTPAWSTIASSAIPVFFDPSMAAGTSPNVGVVYDAPLGRYLLAMTHGDSTGQMGFFEAAEPWGPWATIGYYDDLGGFNESAGEANGLMFPAKWISADGKTLWAVFSGVTNGFDSFNVAKVVLTTSTPAAPSVPDPSEVGYWSFNEGSGSIVNDSSGQGSAGQLLNGPAWTTGESGTALSFNNGAAAVEIPGSGSVANLYQHGMTAAAWIKPGDGATGDRIFDKHNDTVGWLLKMNRDTVQFTGQFNSASVIRYGVRDVTLNGWQHVAVTWDGSANGANVHLYINGVLIDGSFLNGAGSPGDDSGVPLTIGNAVDLASGFGGVIDEVRVFDRVLSAGEVASLATGAGTGTQ